MKFLRMWMAPEFNSTKMNGYVQMEVAGVQFEIALSTDAMDRIMRSMQPDITEGVKRLGREIGVEVGNG